ncbi:MAG: hypothetical protein PVI89_06040, partial [Desulfobacteraceae bacterium]
MSAENFLTRLNFKIIFYFLWFVMLLALLLLLGVSVRLLRQYTELLPVGAGLVCCRKHWIMLM